MGFTVQALLSNPELPGLEVVAGHKGLNNLIRNVTVIDCPDAFDWLEAGDFVLTSGYIFQNDPALQKKLIRELSELACAGLAVKIKKYWDQVPKLMIDEANRRALPILSIPFQCTLNQISHYIFKELYNREDTLLQKYFKIHKQFMAYSLLEHSLDTIAANTVGVVNNPLLIFDRHWNLLSYGEHEKNPVPLSRVLNLSKGKPAFSQDFFLSIPKDIEEYKKPIKRTYETPDGPVPCRILPVRVSSVVYGYLMVWESVRKLRSIEQLGLEQAAIIVALERIKTMRVEESRRMRRQDFFTDLLEGRIESPSYAHSLAEINGLSPNKHYTCAVMQLHTSDQQLSYGTKSDLSGIARLPHRLVRLCEEYFQTHSKSACVFSRNHTIILFLQLKDDEGFSCLELYYQDLIQGLYEMAVSVCEKSEEKPILMMGVGCGQADIVDLKKSFIEAQEAIRISRLMSCSTSVSWFENLMVYNILGSGISKEVLMEFYQSAIGPLVTFDKENNTNLLETLEVFLLENANLSAAAKKLYIHRNTMTYRINKIKSILNTDFEDSEKLLKLQIGIRVMRILNSLGNPPKHNL